MPWKVKANAWRVDGPPEFKVVGELDEYDDDLIAQVAYWVRSMEPGEKVVIERTP